MRRRTACLAAVLSAILIGCSGGARSDGPPAASPIPMASITSPGAAWPAATGAIAAALAGIDLVDARTGDTFRIADLVGRTVLIEPMAIWCTSCRRLQGEAKLALGRLDRDGVLYLSLDVDPSEDSAQLAAYADRLGFDWLFAVAPTSLALALADEFGDQVLNPPSTPLLLLRPDGTLELVGFGHRTADELVAIAGA